MAADAEDVDTIKRKLNLDNDPPEKRFRRNSNCGDGDDDDDDGDNSSDDDENVTKWRRRPVDRRQFRRAGPYILGPKIGHSPVESIVQYLAKKDGTDEFVQLKVVPARRCQGYYNGISKLIYVCSHRF